MNPKQTRRSERSSRRDRRPRRSQRRLAAASALVLGSSLLAACGGSADDELVWYVNPDSGGQAAIAARCSEGKPYTIKTQQLPQDAGQQRIQLARRIAAGDTGIDIMSIDPPYTAEFAEAGYLAKIPEELQKKLTDQSFEGAIKAATWKDQVVVAPLWSNTQVLWYRKSVVKDTPVGKKLDAGDPVTWDEIIDLAASKKKQIAVQANKYEGYVVWINSLVAGAGGDLVSDVDKGVDATIDIDSDAGRAAAHVIQRLAKEAAPSDLSVAQEGQATTTFGSDTGSFLVNWTYTWGNYDTAQPEVKKDLAFAAYPQTVEGKDSRPPYGGIGLGVSSKSEKKDWAMEAVDCLTSADNQAVDAALTGNMPASEAGYESVKKGGPEGLDKAQRDALLAYPDELIELWKASLDASAPRSVTPYWSDISGAIQSTWHPASSVTDKTPAESADFIGRVLRGEDLL
jgi:multiple sugar transport system substrate-binding protein